MSGAEEFMERFAGDLDVAIAPHLEVFHQSMEVIFQEANRQFDLLSLAPQAREQHKEKHKRVVNIQTSVATLLDEIDATEKGAIFQIMERSAIASSLSRQMLNKASKAGAKAGYKDINTIMPLATPFLSKLSPENAPVSYDKVPNSDTYKQLLLKLSDQSNVSEKFPFLTFAYSTVELEGCNNIWASVASLLTQPIPSNWFDKFRVEIIVAATFAVHNEPCAFDYVALAMGEAAMLVNPEEKMLACLMLKAAMDYAFSVNAYNQMQIMGNGAKATSSLMPLPGLR